MPTFDLLVRAGRMVCPTMGLDGPGAVAVQDGRIIAASRKIEGDADQELDFPDGILLPGLIDLHAHPARSGSKYGVDPDREFLPRGVTTVLSQGDAGADNWLAYRDETIRGSKTRVRLALNLSRLGETMPGGCLEELAWADVEACLAVLQSGGDEVWGTAVNVSEIGCGKTDPRAALQRALRVRDESGKPLLFGIHVPRRWPLAEQLGLLRAGDVMTYCFRGGEHSIVQPDGRVHPAVKDARARGVLFDVGHGMGSFSFPVAEAALADGFPPDTLSTDSYARHVGQSPPHSLPRTMAKLRAVGMTEQDIFAAVTRRPAEILGLEQEIGCLRPGSCADLTVLHRDDSAPLTDVDGQTRSGEGWTAVVTIRAGNRVEG